MLSSILYTYIYLFVLVLHLLNENNLRMQQGKESKQKNCVLSMHLGMRDPW